MKESQLPEVFHSDAFGMLIVAEKYQTGFDEPLLHTMFVDKQLSGVKAVQTLSRLNRTMPGKQDTFVLDFVNSAEDIRKAFEPYYEETVLEEETNPHVIYDLKNTLDEYRVYQQAEIDRFAEIFYAGKAQTRGDMGRLESTLRPALDRFSALEEESRICSSQPWRGSTASMPFITQVCRLFDRGDSQIQRICQVPRFPSCPMAAMSRYRWTTRCFWSTTGWKRTTKAPLS